MYCKLVSSCFFSSVVILLFCAGCQKSLYRFNEGLVFGTVYHITYKGPDDLHPEIREELKRVDGSLSIFNKTSVITRINRNESSQADSLFRVMYVKAREVYEKTEGAFDITVAPLTNAWGFGYKQGKIPAKEEIDSILKWVGMDKVEMEGSRVIKAHDSIQFDAGAIAKGLAVDQVAALLEKHAVENYFVEIGGEVRVKGVNRKQLPWRVGIDAPEDTLSTVNRGLSRVIGLQQGALATSGNYRNFYVVDGVKYAHTMDPSTGYPVQRDIISASVYAPTCMEADAYATAFMVLGRAKSEQIVYNHPCLEAYFIWSDREGERQEWMSDGFKKRVLME